MPVPKLAESEGTIMEALWTRSPQTALELTRALRDETNWAENTVRTLLQRLVEKKAVKVAENAGGTRVFAPAIKRESYVTAESDSFMKRIFRGASSPLLVHFARNARLTPDEVKELKALLDESLKNKPPADD